MDVDREVMVALLAPRPNTVGAFVSRFRANFPTLLKRGMISGAVGLVIGWLANVYVMAYQNDGFYVPAGAAATGKGNVGRGSLFWFVGAAVVSSVVNYRLAVGRDRFWSDVRSFPSTVKALFAADGDTALMHLLWGFAGSIVFSFVLGPSVSGALAVVLVVSLGTVLRPVVTGLALIAWRWLLKRVAPDRQQQLPPIAMTVATLGASAAMAVSFLVSSRDMRLLVGLLAAGGAFYLMRRPTSPGAALPLMLLAGTVAAVLAAGIEHAFADDGGWKECGNSLVNWSRCGGANRVRWLALYGGAASGAGAFLGPAAGQGMSDGTGEPPKQWSEMTPDERAQWEDRIVERWRAANPDAPLDREQRFREGIRAKDATWWGNSVRLANDTWEAYKKDVISGRQAEGLWETAVGGWEGFSKAATRTWDGFKGTPEFMVNLAAAYGEDVASGRQQERLLGLINQADAAIKVADEFYSMSADQQRAAYAKYGKENVDAFMRAAHEFDQSLQSKDPNEIRRAIGNLAGQAEFDVLTGALLDKGFKVAKGGSKLDDLVPEGGVPKGRADILYGREGVDLTPDDLVKVGVDPKRAEALIAEMKRTGGEVWLKPGSEEAIAWREAGAIGKPELMKSKSSSPLDAYIGLGNKGDSGLVTYGAPDPPKRPPGMSRAQWDEVLPEVNDRYAQRLSEYHDNAAVMNKAREGKMIVDGQERPLTMMVDGREQAVKIDWRGGGEMPDGKSFGDGVVYAITQDGRKIPVAGDVDIFTSKIPGGLDKAMPGLQRADPGIVHQADTPNWKPEDPKLQQVRDKIVDEHSSTNPNGQNVIRINGDGISTVRWPGR